MTVEEAEKEQIVQLVSHWRERSGLSINQIVARIQARGYDISRAMFENRFIRYEPRPDIVPELTLATIAAFTESLTDNERCTAAEAIRLADLTRLPIGQFQELREFFPKEELDEALKSYLSTITGERIIDPPPAIVLDFSPKVEISREKSDRLMPAHPLMALYPNDAIHTYINATATLFCKDSKLFFYIPEQNIFVVDCHNKEDKRIVGQLDLLLYGDTGSVLESIRELALSETAQNYLLAQRYRAQGKRDRAINRLEQLVEIEKIAAAHLWQQLGDLYVETRIYPKAVESYQMALKAAKREADEPGQAAAHLGLACVAQAMNNEEKILRHLKAITADRYTEITEIFLALYQDPAEYIYEGQAALSDYVRFLTEKAAPHLLSKLRAIPDSFLARLEAQRDQPKLRQNVTSTVPLGSGFEAMELLAVAYITTKSLVEMLSASDIEEQLKTGRLSATLQEQAKQVAEEIVGLDPQRAKEFAEQYAVLTQYNLKTLHLLVRQST